MLSEPSVAEKKWTRGNVFVFSLPMIEVPFSAIQKYSLLREWEFS